MCTPAALARRNRSPHFGQEVGSAIRRPPTGSATPRPPCPAAGVAGLPGSAAAGCTASATSGTSRPTARRRAARRRPPRTPAAPGTRGRTSARRRSSRPSPACSRRRCGTARGRPRGRGRRGTSRAGQPAGTSGALQLGDGEGSAGLLRAGPVLAVTDRLAGPADGAVDPAGVAGDGAGVASGAGPPDRAVQGGRGDTEPVGGLLAGVLLAVEEGPLLHQLVAGPGAARVVFVPPGAALPAVAGLAQATRVAVWFELGVADAAVAHANLLAFGTGAKDAGRHTGLSTGLGAGWGCGLLRRGFTVVGRLRSSRSRSHALQRRSPFGPMRTLSPLISCTPTRQNLGRGRPRRAHDTEHQRR